MRPLRCQALGRLPRRSLLLASPELPVVVDALGPEDPQAARRVGGYCATEDVAGLGGHLFGRGPDVVGPRAQEHAIGAIAVGDPRRGNRASGKRGDSRLVVFILRRRAL